MLGALNGTYNCDSQPSFEGKKEREPMKLRFALLVPTVHRKLKAIPAQLRSVRMEERQREQFRTAQNS
jgi:hypothetical protein